MSRELGLSGIVTGGRQARGRRDKPEPMSKEMADILGDVPLFAGLSRRHLHRVAGLATTRWYQPGSDIVKAGDPGDSFFVILNGRASVRLGARRIVLQTGDFFGEMAALRHGHRPHRGAGHDGASLEVHEAPAERAEGGADDTGHTLAAGARPACHGQRLTATHRVPIVSEPVELWTDGACSGNPGPGGWAAVLRWNEHVREISGGDPQTTNNRMELTSVIEGLKALTRPVDVVVHVDSAYVEGAFTQGWIERWRQNGWRTADKKPVKNQDLWEQLAEQVERHRVTWKRVRGHAGVEWNERADELAVAERDRAAGVTAV
jgi:ribonuclease HI